MSTKNPEADGDEIIYVPTSDLVTAKNVRNGNGGSIDDLAASIAQQGILQPLLVTRRGTKSFEVVCGHRRREAALKLALEKVPVIVRDMTPAERLEAQIAENDQRVDVHPLDQAHGYAELMKIQKVTADEVAARLGRSVAYVYDRTRLLGLVPDAQRFFREGRIQIGHAIVLARLTAAEQKRAIADGLFEVEQPLLMPEDDSRRQDHKKARTVRELQGWIDEHVRFNVKASDLPQLFPDAAAALETAKQASRKIVAISYGHFVKEDARDPNDRTFCESSWRRADGKKQSKPCEFSVLGVVAAGPGRGEAFDVCVDKTKCRTHWPKQASAAARGTSRSAPEKPAKKVVDHHEKQRAKEQAERDLWKRAEPQMLTALVVKLVKSKPRATGAVADMLVAHAADHDLDDKTLALMPRGKTAEDLVRYLTFILAANEVCGYWAPRNGPKTLKLVGIDAKAILKKAPAPAEKPAGSEEADEE